MTRAFIKCTMFIHLARPLALQAFKHPLSTLAKPHAIPRVTSALLGIRIHNLPNIASYRAATGKLQQQGSHRPTHSSSAFSPPPSRLQQQTPTDAAEDLLKRYHSDFTSLGIDKKLYAIRTVKSHLVTEFKDNSRNRPPAVYQKLTQGLSLKEKEILDKDTWWKKAFRSIAWGPTILINMIITLFL